MNEAYAEKAAYNARDVAPEESAISTALQALSEARNLSDRVQDMANRICGQVPPSAVAGIGGPKDPMPGGILPDLSQAARGTMRCLSEAFSELARIERALP